MTSRLIAVSALVASATLLAVGCSSKVTRSSESRTTQHPPTATEGVVGSDDSRGVDPTRRSDPSVVRQVMTEAIGRPYVVPSRNSPDSFSIDVWYDTRSGRDGVHFNSTTDGRIAASFSAAGRRDFFTLAESGTLRLQDGTKVSWQNFMRARTSNVKVTIGSKTYSGDQFGDNYDDRTSTTSLTVKQVLDLGKRLAAVGTDHFS